MLRVGCFTKSTFGLFRTGVSGLETELVKSGVLFGVNDKPPSIPQQWPNSVHLSSPTDLCCVKAGRIATVSLD